MAVRETWMSRECGQIHHGIIIMPMAEYDSAVYPIGNQLPPVPGMFEKIPCERCGRLLQNHLIILNSEIK